jgi:hypothetical protein
MRQPTCCQPILFYDCLILLTCEHASTGNPYRPDNVDSWGVELEREAEKEGKGGFFCRHGTRRNVVLRKTGEYCTVPPHSLLRTVGPLPRFSRFSGGS